MGVIVITGANRGIGLAMAAALHAAGRKVVAVCRRPTDELEAIGCRVETDVDVTEASSISALADRLSDVTIDVLVNNAGILESNHLEDLDIDSVRRQFEVNALGPLMVTRGLMERFSRPAKVAIITSRMGSIADNTTGGMYGYRMSKAAVNAAGRSLALDLAHCDVAVGLFHPGFVQTRMTGQRGDVDAETSARRLVQRIDELDSSNAGRFIHANGEVLPW
jgi:NAD(P)-dependent dehydrogenase (short-subunit alcohol dehydrogenase family)